MKITNEKTHFTFSLNEGHKKTAFTINRPKRTTFELANKTVNIVTTSDKQSASLSSLTASEAQSIVQQFLHQYKGYQLISEKNTHQIVLDQTKGFSIFIEMV